MLSLLVAATQTPVVVHSDGTPWWVAVVTVTIALLALLFTIASFWWLYARKGKLAAAHPKSYAFFGSKVRLRLPLGIYNTGAQALILSNLRVRMDDDERAPLPWQSTRTQLRPESMDGHDFPTPFAVPGRSTREVIAEFGDDDGWSPAPNTEHRLRVEAKIHPSDGWVDLVEFAWWSPPAGASIDQYLAYENEPE